MGRQGGGVSLLGRILTAPVLGPIRGVLWLARTIDDQARAELYDEDKVRGALAELELRLDLGEIAPDDYDAQEHELLQRLKEIREAKKDGRL